MKNPAIPVAAAALLAVGLAQAASAQEARAQAEAQPQSPQGRWVTESGNLEVEIAPCGADAAKSGNPSTSAATGTLCGKVVRVFANRSMGAPGTDMAAADARPALGMTLLSGLRPTDGGSGNHGQQHQGQIYNRENAKTYRATLTPAESDLLLVRAYVGIPLFGKTQVWRRPAAEHGGVQ